MSVPQLCSSRPWLTFCPLPLQQLLTCCPAEGSESIQAVHILDSQCFPGFTEQRQNCTFIAAMEPFAPSFWPEAAALFAFLCTPSTPFRTISTVIEAKQPVA